MWEQKATNQCRFEWKGHTTTTTTVLVSIISALRYLEPEAASEGSHTRPGLVIGMQQSRNQAVLYAEAERYDTTSRLFDFDLDKILPKYDGVHRVDTYVGAESSQDRKVLCLDPISPLRSGQGHKTPRYCLGHLYTYMGRIFWSRKYTPYYMYDIPGYVYTSTVRMIYVDTWYVHTWYFIRVRYDA